MQVIGKTIIPIIISASILVGCSNQNGNSQEIVSESKVTFEQPHQDQASFLNFNTSKQIVNKKVNNPVEEAIGKNLNINDIFSKGVTFTKNKGQLDRFYDIKGSELGEIEFYSKSFGGTAYFMKKGIGFGFTKGSSDEQLGEDDHHNKKDYYESINFNLIFENSNNNVSITPSDKQEGVINYFKGHVKDHITDIASFETISYENLYDNIDLKYYQNNGELKYDYIVKAGANMQDISMKYDGAKSVSLNEKGELEIETEWGVLIDKAPYSYQEINGKKKEIDIRYFIDKKGKIKFKSFENYDKNKTLIIDPPTMVWASFAASSGNGYLMDVATDNNGNIYGTGWYGESIMATTSLNTFNSTLSSAHDVFVFKLSNDGTTMLYAGFIGGSADDTGWGIDVNEAGEAFVTGHTLSSDFTVTDGTNNAGSKDIFIAKINAAGNALEYSTLYGGTNDDMGYSIAIDSLDNAYVTGMTNSTSGIASGAGIQQNSFGGNVDGFILKLNSNGSTVDYCTYLGGSGPDYGRSIAVQGTNAYVTGVSESNNGIINSTGFDISWNGGTDAFIIKYDDNGSQIYSTYIGGTQADRGEDIAINLDGEAVIVGATRSNGVFPTTSNALQSSNAGARDAFMVKVSTDGSALLYGTFMGTPDEDVIKGENFNYDLNHKSSGVDISQNGIIAAVITTGTAGLPLVNSISPFNDGEIGRGDAYVFVTNPAGDTILFSTYYGGSENDYATGGVKWTGGGLYVAGSSHSPSIPGTDANSHAGSRNGNGDIPYVVKYECIFSSTINDVDDSTVCNEYVLPEITGESLTGSEYYEVDGGGILNAGDTITSSGIVRIIGSSVSCVNSVAFYITVESSPVIKNIIDTTACDKYLLRGIEGDFLTGNEYYLFDETTNVLAGDTIYESGLISINDTSINCFNKEVFTLTIENCDTVVTPPIDSINNEIIIPTGFTPDNDGFNDIWDLAFLVDYPDADVQVYNRWGMQVYSTKGGANYEPFNGEDLPVGSYPYIIVLNDTDGSTFKGNLSLVR